MNKLWMALVILALVAVAWGGYRLGVGVESKDELGPAGRGSDSAPASLSDPQRKDAPKPIEVGTATPSGPVQAAALVEQLRGKAEAPSIGGLVVDPEGNPVAEAMVELLAGISSTLERPVAGRPLDGAVTSASGSFAFESRSVPGARYLLRVRHPDFAWHWLSGVDSLQPRSLNPRITLVPGHTLRGTIRAAGRSVADALVRIVDLDAPVSRIAARWEAEARTDGEGVYRFDHLRAGRKLVQVEAAGFGPRSSQAITLGAVEGEDARVDVELGSGRSVAGRVVEAGTGTPISGAEILVRPLDRPGRPEAPVAARSGSDGGFRLEGTFAGSLVITVRHERYLEAVVSAPSPGDELVVELSPGAAMSGTVSAPGGFRGPFVVALAPSPQAVVPIGRSWSFDGADGAFEIPNCPPGNHWLVVQAPGHPLESAGPFQIGAGERLRGIRIELKTGALLSGRVVGVRGRGLANARVTLVEERRFRGSNPRMEAIGLVRKPLRVTRLDVRSLEDGSFVLPGAGDGEFRVRVEAEGYAPLESAPLQISGAGVHELPDLRLWRASGLSGSVVAPDGKLLPYGRVVLVPVDVVAKGQVTRQVVADVEGHFHIGGLLPGVYRVQALRNQALVPKAQGGDQTTLVEGETKSVQLLAQW